MSDDKTYQIAAIASGIGAATLTSAFAPNTAIVILLVISLSGYVGALLPEIDHKNSLSYRIVYRLTRAAALLVPFIQFFYRPTDLIIAVPLTWFLVTQCWHIVDYFTERGGQTHSVLAAVSLSLAVAFVAYLTVDVDVIVPAFLAAAFGYLLHLLLDDLHGSDDMTQPPKEPPLRFVDKQHTTGLYSIIFIGLFSGMALWLL